MKRTTFRGVLLFLGSLVFAVQGSRAPAQTLSFEPSPQYVALTFDDGPRPASTARLLRMLERHHVPATFFIVGHVGNKHPEAVQRIAAAGHELASHSWSHGNFHRLSARQIRWELDATRELIARLTGQVTWFFRVPGGTEHSIRKHFDVPSPYTMVLWDVHSMDHARLSAEDIHDRVSAGVSDGDIVLLHNGTPATVEALDCLIPELKARGFEFVVLSELLEKIPHNRYALSSALVQG